MHGIAQVKRTDLLLSRFEIALFAAVVRSLSGKSVDVEEVQMRESSSYVLVDLTQHLLVLEVDMPLTRLVGRKRMISISKLDGGTLRNHRTPCKLLCDCEVTPFGSQHTAFAFVASDDAHSDRLQGR